MRTHRLDLVAFAFAEDQRANQSGDARVDVNHGAARKVERAEAPDETRTSKKGIRIRGIRRHDRTTPPPDHVRHRVVDSDRPENREEHDAPEFRSFSNAAKHECGGDAGEGHLEGHEDDLGNGDTDREALDHRCRINAREADLREAADELVQSAPIREGHRVAPADPGHHADRRDDQDLAQQRDHVLRADETAVEERKTRDDHEQDEDRRDKHPGRVALVDCQFDSGRRCFFCRSNLRSSRFWSDGIGRRSSFRRSSRSFGSRRGFSRRLGRRRRKRGE